MSSAQFLNLPQMPERLNPSRVIIGCDLDEVVFPYAESLRTKMLEAGLNPPDGDPVSYNMSESGWFDSITHFREFHGGEVDKGLYAGLVPFDDASETLRELVHSGYTNSIITSRFVNPGQHQKVVAQTVASLDDGRIPYSSLSFSDNKVLTLADVYIDDAPHNLIALYNAGRVVIRKRMRYNEDCPGFPVDNWGEIREALQEIFGQ